MRIIRLLSLYTRQRKWEFIIAAALSPDRMLDRSEKVEVAVLLYKSDIGDLIKEYEKKAIIGKTLIVDEQGSIIYEGHAGEEGIWYLNQMNKNNLGIFEQKVQCYSKENQKDSYTYFVIRKALKWNTILRRNAWDALFRV